LSGMIYYPIDNYILFAKVFRTDQYKYELIDVIISSVLQKDGIIKIPIDSER